MAQERALTRAMEPFNVVTDIMTQDCCSRSTGEGAGAEKNELDVGKVTNTLKFHLRSPGTTLQPRLGLDAFLLKSATVSVQPSALFTPIQT